MMAAPAGRSSAWEAHIDWKGLTRLVYACKQGVKKEFGPACSTMTKSVLGKVYERAYLNLSGRMVNVVTGFLRSRLQVKQVNQYAGYVFDDAFYSVFVHDGTRHMQGRPFLSEAVWFVQGQVPGEMGKALSTCFKNAGLM